MEEIAAEKLEQGMPQTREILSVIDAQAPQNWEECHQVIIKGFSA